MRELQKCTKEKLGNSIQIRLVLNCIFNILLMVQNFKIAFNCVVAIIFTLRERSSLEKCCFRLTVFVQLSS